MKTITAAFLALSFVSAFAQGQGKVPKPVHRAPAAVDLKSPVTKAEARATFVRAARALGPAIGVKFAPPSIAQSGSPASRLEIVAELSRMFVAAQPKFKMTPRKIAFERSRLTLKDPRLEKLIAYGAIARIGPLAAGSSNTLTVRQFGDAIGYFVARIADLTHTPSSKWTPGLHE